MCALRGFPFVPRSSWILYVVREDDQARGGSVLHDRHRGSDAHVWRRGVREVKRRRQAGKSNAGAEEEAGAEGEEGEEYEEVALVLSVRSRRCTWPRGTSRSRNMRPRRRSRPCSLCEKLVPSPLAVNSCPICNVCLHADCQREHYLLHHPGQHHPGQAAGDALLGE